MRNTMLLGLLWSLMSCGQPNPQIDSSKPSYEDGLVPLVQSKQQDNIPNHYIVVLNESSTLLNTYTSNEQFVSTLSLDPKDAQVKSIYKATVNGFSATLNDKALNQLRRNPDIKYIEQDTKIKLPKPILAKDPWLGLNVDEKEKQSYQPYPAAWGLDRIDQRSGFLNNLYTYKESAGKGVSIYMLSSGINFLHADLRDVRKRRGLQTVPGAFGDYFGLGIHEAATLVGRRFGVAKNANLVSLKLFDSNGEGTLSGVIDGIEWTAIDAKYNDAPAVASITFATPRSKALDEVVAKALKTHGLVIVASAGYGDLDSCDASPAGVPGVITAAGSTIKDRRSSFTSGGKCVDLFAPGEYTNSAWYAGNFREYPVATVVNINTAAQYVAGAVALLQSQQPLRKWTPKEVMDTLIANSTKNAIVNPGDIPHGRLLYTKPF